MGSKNPYKKSESIIFDGNTDFEWEFQSEEIDISEEEEYNSFLAKVYDYKAELYEPYIT